MVLTELPICGQRYASNALGYDDDEDNEPDEDW